MITFAHFWVQFFRALVTVVAKAVVCCTICVHMCIRGDDNGCLLLPVAFVIVVMTKIVKAELVVIFCGCLI